MATYEYLTQAGLSRYNDKIKATYATKTAVTSEIAAAIAGVTQFDYQIVASLPASGEKGIIYLVKKAGTEDQYDQYVWVANGGSGEFVSIGGTNIDIVEYVGDGVYTTVVDGTGADAGKKVIQLAASKKALLDNALQAITSNGGTLTVTGDGTTKNIEIAAEVVSGATAGATATQPEDFGPISNADIDALFD